MNLVKENKDIVDVGHYTAPSGRTVDVAREVTRTLAKTRRYDSDELEKMLALGISQTNTPPPKIEVVEGKTGDTARGLASQVDGKIGLLNFASARNAGGGYLGGAKAQEEDLCRCSALYHALELQGTEYYKANRRQSSMLYSDNMIFSPSVPFFRDDETYELLEEPAMLSVITAPAPNAGEFKKRGGVDADLEQVLRRRAGYVLALAEAHGIRNLVLGAWGCGVFRNDPELVADAFGKWLEDPRFIHSFDRVVFGIYASGLPGQVNLEVFRQRFE